MRVRPVALLGSACSTVVLSILVAGCASDGTSAPSAAQASAGVAPMPTPQDMDLTRPQPTPAPQAGSQGRPSAAKPAPAAIPNGARYTIICRAFPGPGQAQNATISKDNLIRATGRREFYVVHEENQSTIYFGYYREYQRDVDPKEAARADEDMKFIKNLADEENHPLFARSLFVPLPAADPVAPAEYDLARLDSDKPKDDPDRKYWSIAIAAYTSDATPTGEDAGKSRKQLAVESVMAARKQGIEAYYYHGPSISMVCIGAWPRRAIQQQMTDNEIKRGDNGDPLIYSATRLPEQVLKDIENSGKHVTVVQPKVEFTDESLKATWKAYPEYLVNGQLEVDVVTDPASGEKRRQPKGSFLVEIPLAQQPNSLLAGSRSSQAAQPEQAPETNPLLPGQGLGGGRLRSVRP